MLYSILVKSRDQKWGGRGKGGKRYRCSSILLELKSGGVRVHQHGITIVCPYKVSNQNILYGVYMWAHRERFFFSFTSVRLRKN